MRKAYLVAVAAMVLVGGALFADTVKSSKCDGGKCVKCTCGNCGAGQCQNGCSCK